jgi:hypothetical protein
MYSAIGSRQVFAPVEVSAGGSYGSSKFTMGGLLAGISLRDELNMKQEEPRYPSFPNLDYAQYPLYMQNMHNMHNMPRHTYVQRPGPHQHGPHDYHRQQGMHLGKQAMWDEKTRHYPGQLPDEKGSENEPRKAVSHVEVAPTVRMKKKARAFSRDFWTGPRRILVKLYTGAWTK